MKIAKISTFHIHHAPDFVHLQLNKNASLLCSHPGSGLQTLLLAACNNVPKITPPFLEPASCPQKSDRPPHYGVAGSRWCHCLVQVTDIGDRLHEHQLQVFFNTFVTFTYCCPFSHSDIKKLRLFPVSVLCEGGAPPAIPSPTGFIPFPGFRIQHSVPTGCKP